jgi:hypothetical protein
MSKTSKTIEITSGQQFNAILASSKAVVADCELHWKHPAEVPGRTLHS